jgi:hypothetical protein
MLLWPSGTIGIMLRSLSMDPAELHKSCGDESRPPAGGVGKDCWCDSTGSEGRVLAVRKGDCWASMFPVGKLSMLRLSVLAVLLLDIWRGGNSRDSWKSSCTLAGRLTDGTLCEFDVSMDQGVSICEALHLPSRCCSIMLTSAFKIDCNDEWSCPPNRVNEWLCILCRRGTGWRDGLFYGGPLNGGGCMPK